MVKLKIEMSMAELIAKVASSPHVRVPSPYLPPDVNLSSSCSSSSSANPKTGYTFTSNDVDSKLTKTFATSKDVNWSVKKEETWGGRSSGNEHSHGEIRMNMRREVHVLVERRNSLAPSCRSGEERCEAGFGADEDTKPLKDVEQEREREGEMVDSTLTGMDRSMGMSDLI